MAVTHPPSGCAGSTPARRTDWPVRLSAQGRQPLKLEGWVRFPYGLTDMAKWWNWQTRDAQNVVPVTGVGVRLSPWSLRSGLESGFQHESHKPFARRFESGLRNLTGRVRKPAKRPGREPGDDCGFDSHLGYCNGPVVQRQRLLADIQATMVRVHPGSLMGCWSNRKTPAPHAGNEGATPSRSTSGGRKAVIRQPWKLETVGSIPTPLT